MKRAPPTAALWKCPDCGRSFTQKNQRHACGVGTRSDILRDRPAGIVELYAAVETFAKALGSVEIVTRERYALFRSVRIFADLTVTRDALRMVVHLRRVVTDPIFFKVASSKNVVSHVAMLKTKREFQALEPYLKEAYQVSLEARAARPS